MKELDFINAKLGGHKITLDGIRILMNQAKKRSKEKKPDIAILEIGCGGGDNLRVIKNYFKRKNIQAWLSGVDINPHCIEFAQSRKENQGIEFFLSDYKLFLVERKPDIIFCSLFCHHFTDEQVIEILKWMKERSAVGFFINDLHRHPLAYYSIKWLAKLFSKSEKRATLMLQCSAPWYSQVAFALRVSCNLFDIASEGYSRTAGTIE